MAATTPVVVRVQSVSKRFTIRKTKSIKERVLNPLRGRAHTEAFDALSDISLDIYAGSTIGLIGPNGSGKSTLLKAIGGIIQPSRGTVERRGSLAALLELGTGFHPDLTGRENVYLNAAILGLTREETDARFEEIVEFSGIPDFIDTQVKFYSSGMYVRLAFAVAVHADPDVLLVDEVLAVGDEAFQVKCLERIRRFQQEGRTIVLVTHTLSQITDFCTRAIVLARGNVIFDGDPDGAVDILRSGYAALGGGALNQSDPEAGVRVDAIRVLDASGRAVDEVEGGDDLIIEVDITSRSDVEEWAFGVQMNTMLGQLVFATDTDRVGSSLPLLHGSLTVRVSIPRPQIGAGRYSINAAVHGRTADLARLSEGAYLTVRAGSASQGPLYVTPDVTVMTNR